MRYLVLAAAVVVVTPSAFAQESGYQVIQGTRVFTQIDHAADTATFSNDCGSQTISHQALGAGAIPTDIIPCPRPDATESTAPAPAPPPPQTSTVAPPPNDPGPEPRGGDPEPDPTPTIKSTGSFAQTCQRCSETDHVLTCECRRIDQTYMRTALDFRRCDGTEIENIDGRLQCVRVATSPSHPTRRSTAAERQPGAPDACIEMGKTIKVSSACDFHEGVPMYRTYMRVDQRPEMHCPRDIEVEYTEMASGQRSTYIVGPHFTGVETCGGGIADAHVRQR